MTYERGELHFQNFSKTPVVGVVAEICILPQTKDVALVGCFRT